MKYHIRTMFVMVALAFTIASCNQKDLDELYPDPSKSSTASIENFFTGVLKSANENVMPWYNRFFVVEQPTMGHYTQTMGWINGKDQYIPSGNSMDWKWNQYYNGPMTQFRELQKLYEEADETEKKNKRIFMIASTIFFYDRTAQFVDLFDDIPWSEAGTLRYGDGLQSSLAKYDKGSDIYSAILDDLKDLAGELATIDIEPFYANLFMAKDFLNDGDVTLWQKYCNSLRLRLLIRVSDVMEERVVTEISEILADPSRYPLITGNDDDVMLDAWGPDLFSTTSSGTGGIQQAMLTWDEYDLAPKAMVDHMKENKDPRLEITFDENKNGEYIGMDPLEDASVQDKNRTDSIVSRYDASTFVRNDYFPGFVITAAEVSFLKSEAYLKEYAPGDAKEEYEKGIRQSIEMYYEINQGGDYREPLPFPEEAIVEDYLNQPDIAWDNNPDKIKLLAEQKWLNSGLGQMPLTWAEMRRLDLPKFTFLVDQTSGQKAPPVRWLYPESEKNLNGNNYQEFKDKDDLNNKVFWDVN